MKKPVKIIGIIIVVLAVALNALVLVGNAGSTGSKEVTLVTAPDQESAMENEQFTVAEFEMPEIKGKNVAINTRAIDNGYNDVYDASLAIDGTADGPSYWEGATDVEEAQLTVNMKKAYNIHTIVIKLCPKQIWSKRTQHIAIRVSNDGKKFTDLIAYADYEFDPNTGNMVIMDDFKETKAQYVQVAIDSNTGAKSGQVAELEVYSNDK
jgi:hypothetical protein